MKKIKYKGSKILTNLTKGELKGIFKDFKGIDWEEVDDSNILFDYNSGTIIREEDNIVTMVVSVYEAHGHFIRGKEFVVVGHDDVTFVHLTKNKVERMSHR
jgi:hypothetical protein